MVQHWSLHLVNFFNDRINEHVKELGTDAEELTNMRATDLVGAFLKEKARLEKAGDPALCYYNFDQLKVFCFDVWIAGQVGELPAVSKSRRRRRATRSVGEWLSS